MTHPWSAQYFWSAKIRSWKVRGGVPVFSAVGGMVRSVLAGAKYSRGLRWQRLQVDRAHLVDLGDRLAVPGVAQMHALPDVLHQSRPEHRHAFTARAPDAVEGHAV